MFISYRSHSGKKETHVIESAVVTFVQSTADSSLRIEAAELYRGRRVIIILTKADLAAVGFHLRTPRTPRTKGTTK